MTYGSPASLERPDIAAYLARVRGGRPADPELVDEFARRYRLIGGSPLIEITRRQAAALSSMLGWPVEVGMRFPEPSLAPGPGGLRQAGLKRVAAIVLPPPYSPVLMGRFAAPVHR